MPRGAHTLLAELTAHPRDAPGRRFTVATAGGLAVRPRWPSSAVVSVSTQSAFAGWTAVPTTPTNDQTSAALASCRAAPAAGPAGTEVTPPPVPIDTTPVLTDTRGPYTLLLFDGGETDALCVSGPGLLVVSGTGSAGGRGFAVRLGLGRRPRAGRRCGVRRRSRAGWGCGGRRRPRAGQRHGRDADGHDGHVGRHHPARVRRIEQRRGLQRRRRSHRERRERRDARPRRRHTRSTRRRATAGSSPGGRARSGPPRCCSPRRAGSLLRP